MLLAAYVPTWDGVWRALPEQMFLVLIFAVGLFAFGCRRHRPLKMALALIGGMLCGVALGLLKVWLASRVPAAEPAKFQLSPFEENVIAYLELGGAAIAAVLGLAAGWLILDALERDPNGKGRAQADHDETRS